MAQTMSENKSSKKHVSWIKRFKAKLKHEPQTKDQLMSILRRASEHDVLSGDVLGMIERILHVADMQVREVMVPKAQMVVVKKNSKLEKLLPIVIESGHSRFPVLDPSGKDIVGILLAKDLLKGLFQHNEKEIQVTDIIRPAIFTPQSKRLDILLREFRINRNHIAIVLDEYGHVAGLVTIEDVLEQIVGEIEDEYDIEEEGGHIKKLNDGSYIVKAVTPIEEFNDYFHVDFSLEDFDTIGGIVLKSFGHLPQRGENTKVQNFRFKILHSDNRRIYLMEVRPIKTKK